MFLFKRLRAFWIWAGLCIAIIALVETTGIDELGFLILPAFIVAKAFDKEGTGD